MDSPYLESHEILFQSVCREPEGDFLRIATPFLFTPDNINELWNKVNKFPTLMGKEINDLADMVDFFVKDHGNGSLESRGLCAQIDDLVGIFWLTDIEWPKQASIHYTFFDRRHKGRIDLCKEAIKYIFSKYKFHRIYTQVPLYARAPMKFVESIGFIKDGRLRSNTYFKGEWYDSNVYSILESEV
jgi:RimJ/RimL family protein N-acetyltransferase